MTTAALWIAYLLNIADGAFTALWVDRFGLEAEANPLGRLMFQHDLVWQIKLLLMGVLFAFLGWAAGRCRLARVGAWLLLVVFTLVTAYHILIAVALYGATQ